MTHEFWTAPPFPVLIFCTWACQLPSGACNSACCVYLMWFGPSKLASVVSRPGRPRLPRYPLICVLHLLPLAQRLETPALANAA